MMLSSEKVVHKVLDDHCPSSSDSSTSKLRTQTLQNYDNLVKHQNPLAQQHSITSQQTNSLSNTAVRTSTLIISQSFYKNRKMKFAFQHKTAFVMPTQNHFPKAIILQPVTEVTIIYVILQPKFCTHFMLPHYMLYVSIIETSFL